ncbi:MAG TPA: hypothetical protein DEB40_14170 [Elusimicrobia bacterium]|nr:hypothetical protein [Elusimicrobiota bacterium]HBT62878.1 hypothetical protein [Elusimicrobiota bacterium]
MRPALALIVLLLAPAALRAENGRTAAATLTRALAARPESMAEAFAAVDGGVDSLGYNPAGLSGAERAEFQSSYARGIARDNFGTLGYAHPLSWGTLAGGFAYYDGGDVLINFSNGTQQTRTAQRDMAGLLSLSVPLSWGLCAGATGKLFRLELAEEARTTGYAADLGAIWRTPLRGLNLGAAVQNLGPDVKFEETADPLPTTLRFGAAYNLKLDNVGWLKEGGFGLSRILFTADVVRIREEKDYLPAAGLELGIPIGEQGYGALRAGYLFSREINSLTVGMGLRQGRWLLDYGLGAIGQNLSNTHHFTFGAKF